MATAAEAHLLCDVANDHEASVAALLGVEQQLPSTIQADGVSQGDNPQSADPLELSCWFGSFVPPCAER